MLAKRRPEFLVVAAEIVRLELGFLVFQVGFVGIVAAFLKPLALGVPVLPKFPEQGALAQGTLEPVKSAHLFRIEGFDPVTL